MQEGRWDAYSPIASITDGGPVEFLITNADKDTYLDLSNTLLFVKAKIVKADGTALVEADKVAPVNLWLHSLWQQIDVSLNDKLITASTNMYPYRAYIESLLSYGDETKTTQLCAALWHDDTPGKMDVVGANNRGYVARALRTSQSQVVDMMGRFHCDMFLQNRPLLNNVAVRLRLTPAKDTFSLMGEGAYKVNLEEVTVFVRKLKVSNGLLLGHLNALEKAPAKYPIRRVLTKYFSVPQGHTLVNEQNLFLGNLPKRLVIGCVGNRAFDGDYAKNPFHFQHFDTNYIALNVAGRQIPAKPLTPDFEGRNYVRSYLNLFANTGKLFHDEGNAIKPYDFAAGYTLFCFDLTPNLTDDQQIGLVRKGDLRLEMHFAKPLPETINVVCYAEFDNIVEIDKTRNVLCDFSN